MSKLVRICSVCPSRSSRGLTLACPYSSRGLCAPSVQRLSATRYYLLSPYLHDILKIINRRTWCLHTVFYRRFRCWTRDLPHERWQEPDQIRSYFPSELSIVSQRDSFCFSCILNVVRAQRNHSWWHDSNPRNCCWLVRRRVQQLCAPSFSPHDLVHLILGPLQFKRPSWQEDAVEEFLASLPQGTYEGLFNYSGRV